MMKKGLIYTLFGLLLFTACSSDDDSTQMPVKRQATVTYLVTPNGLGDNGYNDDAAEGIFAFAKESGTRLRLMLPENEAEAEQMYRQWLTDNAENDSAVLILGSSSYEKMAKELSSSKFQDSSKKGTRVLLFESNAEIDGVSTVMVSHYGVSYLAGAMSQGFDALILAAAEGVHTLEESIAGFQDARNKYAGEYLGFPCQTTLHYLADGEAGFAMPDSAYRYITERSNDAFDYNEMIYPLIGGSITGVIRSLNDNDFTTALMIGMDVDMTGRSSRIPFSVVIRIGDVVKRYLNDWIAGREWPKHQRFGMREGAADIVITPHFLQNLDLWDERYREPDTFQKLYEQYKEEAMTYEDKR
jgi:basic membrane lipoprotein Med (substrate-binding protein (PBP1-ABC) superfamily)